MLKRDKNKGIQAKYGVSVTNGSNVKQDGVSQRTFLTRREFKARWRRETTKRVFFLVPGSFTREEIIVRGLFLRTPTKESEKQRKFFKF